MAGYRTRTRHVHAERVGRCADPEQRDALDEQVRAALDTFVEVTEHSYAGRNGRRYWLVVSGHSSGQHLVSEDGMFVVGDDGTVSCLTPERFAYTYEVDD